MENKHFPLVIPDLHMLHSLRLPIQLTIAANTSHTRDSPGKVSSIASPICSIGIRIIASVFYATHSYLCLENDKVKY